MRCKKRCLTVRYPELPSHDERGTHVRLFVVALTLSALPLSAPAHHLAAGSQSECEDQGWKTKECREQE